MSGEASDPLAPRPVGSFNPLVVLADVFDKDRFALVVDLADLGPAAMKLAVEPGPILAAMDRSSCTRRQMQALAPSKGIGIRATKFTLLRRPRHPHARQRNSFAMAEFTHDALEQHRERALLA